jgi:hypothetical protein
MIDAARRRATTFSQRSRLGPRLAPPPNASGPSWLSTPWPSWQRAQLSRRTSEWVDEICGDGGGATATAVLGGLAMLLPLPTRLCAGRLKMRLSSGMRRATERLTRACLVASGVSCTRCWTLRMLSSRCAVTTYCAVCLMHLHTHNTHTLEWAHEHTDNHLRGGCGAPAPTTRLERPLPGVTPRGHPHRGRIVHQ